MSVGNVEVLVIGFKVFFCYNRMIYSFGNGEQGVVGCILEYIFGYFIC